MTATAERAQQSDISGEKVRRLAAAKLAVWALLAVGAVLRIGRWAHPRSLWLDEIYLAKSVLGRSLHDLLFTPLGDWQAAPPGFLLLVHVFASIFGTGERSLRLVSILFGLASLPLMAAVARRVVGSGGTVVAVACFSFLGPLIYYSNELKPYVCDIVVSLAITLSALKWRDDPTFKRAAIATIVGAIGILFSFPAIFVLAGAGIWMLTREGTARGQAVAVGAIWALVFAVDYLVFLRPFTASEAHPHLVQYWLGQDAFMPHRPIDAIRWIFADLDRLARNPGGMWLDYPDAALIGLIIGIAVAIQRRGKLLLLVAPLPIVLLASAIKQYPFGDRLALFFVPQYLLLIAAGVELLWTNLAGKVAAVAIAGCIVIPSADRAMGYLFYPPGREESLAAYRWVAQHYQPGDAVYLTHFAEPSFHYYESQSGWPGDLEKSGVVYVQPDNLQPWQIAEDVKPLAERGRVWLIVIHAEGGEFSAQIATETAFNQIGHPTVSHAEPGAMAYLYDCTKADSAFAPSLPH
jgi:hypothetical protein